MDLEINIRITLAVVMPTGMVIDSCIGLNPVVNKEWILHIIEIINACVYWRLTY